jgi:hypothetical protein
MISAFLPVLVLVFVFVQRQFLIACRCEVVFNALRAGVIMLIRDSDGPSDLPPATQKCVLSIFSRDEIARYNMFLSDQAETKNL